MYDPECIKIWKRSAHIDQFCRCGAYTSDRIEEIFRFRGLDTIPPRVDDGEFGELWACGYKS